ncbi:carboxypeptidase regulatory-like domain-containing protein [Cellulomonas sp. DKR-3]|uniref:Carboxypeptidase regulatory-like domain-containing protein n=1 Tax=Cellulomonas fulva TaxID=2835530 RepID=A0ABS5U0I6_9CELL|nr:carboxypeptidase regulatory-like domain-containing protein [Cellulomonas fulva]MBT0994906.1 carboxypeptidase regulatory-like domain-containing protein [Cellulomonas fulva]
MPQTDSPDGTARSRHRSRHRAGRTAVALAGALAAVLVATLAPAVPAGAATTITVSGRVTDTASQAVAGVRVAIGPANGGQQHSALTAADGTFAITGVPAGPSALQVDDDWQSDDLWRTQTWDGSAGVEGWQTFDTGAADLTGLTFRLRPTSGVLGRAVDETGKPLANIAWNVYDRDPATGRWVGRQYGPLLTDEDGRMWHPVEPGTQWRLCFTDSWYQPTDDGGGTWTPTVRHQAGCWNQAGTGGVPLEDAGTTSFTDVGQRVTRTVVMKTAGKALTPGYPSVVGTTATGTTLTAYPGTWGPSGVAVRYQWVSYTDEGVREAVAGATGRTLTTTAALAGRYVSVEVTGTRTGYASMTRTAGIGQIGGAAPTTSAPLTIAGTPATGRTLSASDGTVSPGDASTGYEWYVDGVPAGYGPTFAVTTAHRATTVEVRAYYRATGPAGGTRLAQASVRVPGLAFTTVAPGVAGTAVVGKTLTAKVGVWTPTPTRTSYQWYRSGSPIAGATAATYRLTAADRGRLIKVRVTGSRAGYDTASRTSAPTTAVKGVLTSVEPTVSGTPRVGATLTAKVGAWKPSGVTFAYRWFRDGVAISGATAKTYTPRSVDRGHRLHVKVTGARAGYVSQSRTSATTSRVV